MLAGSEDSREDSRRLSGVCHDFLPVPFVPSIKYDVMNAQPANCCRRKIAIVPGFYEANQKLVMEMQSQYTLMKL
jgi:hypothetical protein